MISKENFCNILRKTIENDDALDSLFDRIGDVVNFEPFYETHNTTQVLKALACAVEDEPYSFIIDWYYESERGAHPFCFEENGKKYCIDDIEDLYYYLVGVLEPID